MESDFGRALSACRVLQQKLKDEYLLLTTESDQKAHLEKKLSNNLKNYYRNFVHMDHASDKGVQKSKSLFENEGLGNCYIFIKDVILGLSKDYRIVLALLKKHNTWQDIQSFEGVARVIVDSMFENVVDDDIGHKDILRLIDGIMGELVSPIRKIEELTFSSGLLVHVIRVMTERAEFHSYAAHIVRGTLLELAKLDRPIDFTLIEEQDIKSIKRIPSRKFDSPVKKQSFSKSFYENERGTTKTAAYSEALRRKDGKIRTTASVRTKNRNCVSKDLLKYLSIDDNISFPVFQSATQENESKEELINQEQWEVLLSRKDSSSNGPDVLLLKNLIFMFFGDLFKRLYSMPTMMRLACRLLYDHLMRKFNNRRVCLNAVGNFAIGFWVVSKLKFEDHLVEAGKIADYANSNAKLVRDIILAIVTNDLTKANPAFYSQLNLILTNLRLSVINYLAELINVEVPVLPSALHSEDHCFIKNYSICLSIADISRFLQMVRACREDLMPEHEKLLKKVDRAMQMSEGTSIFGSRMDNNREYSPEEAYVLFSELALPKDLSFDYTKFYTDAFRKEKVKNVFRQVMLNIADLSEMTDFPHDCATLRELFQHILKTRQERLGLNSLDQIPVELKIQYLLTLTKDRLIEELLEPLTRELEERVAMFRRVWDNTKECYLKAISSVIEQNLKISNSETSFKEEAKRIKLDEFMQKAKVNVCLTSAKTRQKEIVLKTNMLNEMAEEEKERIWVENQSKCIHTALNLEFIKALAGEADKTKTKYESHLSSPYKFADIFCALPEVKEKGMSGEDNFGIKEALGSFIEYCIEMIKADKEYSMLAEDLEWLEDNLEQRISKRIYDKLYPKMATYDDLGLYFRLKTLDWITYDHLKVHPLMQVDGMWDIAAKNLKQIDKLKTASEKLNAILECSSIISKSYSLVSPDDRPVAADDIYPIVVYVLIKAAPRRLVSNMNFIEMFANRNKLVSRNGYFFTQLKSVIQYCEGLSHNDLGIDMLDFNCKIYQKEIEYGIYFLQGRRRLSPRTTRLQIDYLKQHYFKHKEQHQPPSNSDA